MIPDAAFTAWFAGPFQQALERIAIPGMAGASWDRKAAYLLWLATDKGASLPSPASEPTTDKPDNRSIFD